MAERRRFKGHLATVLVLGAMSVAVVGILLQLSGFLAIGGSYSVRAVVPQAGSLTEGTSVTMAGVRVGTVQSVERRGVGALVNIRLTADGVTPLPADSQARLGVRTPLGENYVELLPGTSKRDMPADDIIPVSQETEYVEVDQVLSVLRGRTRGRARDMVQGLARAVEDRGDDLNATLKSTSSLLHAGSALTDTLAPERERIALLVDQLGSITREIGDREGSIRAIATQGRTTFQAIADRDDQLRELLDVLPSTLGQVRATTGTLGALSDAGAPVLANLGAALRDIRPAVQRLVPASTEGRAVVRNLDAAAPRLEETLESVTRLAPRAVPALPRVKQALCELNPALRYAAPYTRDILSLIEGFGSATNAYDAIGHTIRLQPLFGENSAFGLPDEASAAAFELVNKGVFGPLEGTGFKPYPKPGQANTSVTEADKLLGPEEFAERSGYVFPRLSADC